MTFGNFDKHRYTPVPSDQITVFQAKLASAPRTVGIQAVWPFCSCSIFRAFNIWANKRDISQIMFGGLKVLVCP